MLYHFSDITDHDALRNADLCIVGSGAAGISLALQFLNTPYRVVILEGGKINYDVAHQDLYQGDTVRNNQADDNYLVSSRLRMLGGTTGHWNGFCRPFDDIDFEKRPWVPNSGWPISAAELEPFYNDAANILQIKPFSPKSDLSPLKNRFLDNDQFKIRDYHFSPPTRFNQVYRKPLETAPNIAVILDANVVNMRVDESNGRVTDVEAASIQKPDKRVSFKAKQVILAAGGIENAKILLNSNEQHASGIGNQRGLVGKYFMEHAEYDQPWNLTLRLPNNDPTEFVYDPSSSLGRTAAIMPTAKTLQQHEMLNASAMLQTYRPGSVTEEFSGIANATHRIDALKAGGISANEYQAYSVFLRIEMTPRKHNQCYLTNETDLFGNQQIALDYKIDALADHTISAFARALGIALGATGIGRVSNYYESGEHFTNMKHGWHHMGTTRMASNPEDGVVDKNGTVFGSNNLHIAGSSVFATGSYANPTFTIVALALRLADHIKSKLTS